MTRAEALAGLTPTMAAHIQYGIAGMSASTERALLRRGLVEDAPDRPGYLHLSKRGEAIRATLQGTDAESNGKGVGHVS